MGRSLAGHGQSRFSHNVAAIAGNVMLVLLATTRIGSIEASSPIDWLGEFLYLPEVLYGVILVWLLFSEPG